MDASLVLLHLSLIDTIGPSVVQRLLASLPAQNLDQLYQMSVADCMAQCGISERIAHKLVAGLLRIDLLEQELLLVDRNKIPWVTLLDPHYPQLLKQIHLPPPILYWQGALPVNQDCLAIVGSREANEYGKAAIDKIVPPLVSQGWTIVSGGARGADTMAHQATLEAAGVTIAVLGSGIMRPYPPENKALFKKIVDTGGALMSAFPVMMESLPQNFPARNRVIAGLSRGCVVIQAAQKSGARITADFCLSQGREVFAIPGPIDDLLSVGCHELIQQGAKLTTKIDDILIEFGQELNENMSFIPKKIDNCVSPEPAHQNECLDGAIRLVPGGHQDPIEAVITRACQNPCSIDELLEIAQLPLIEMTKLLFDLQIKGKISQNMAGLWEKR